MTAQQLFAKMKEDGAVCREGMAFARRFHLLSKAWQKCMDGRHMAYWLIFIVGKQEQKRWATLSRLSRRSGMEGQRIIGGTPETQAKFARAIRGAFNCDGSRRKRAVR